VNQPKTKEEAHSLRYGAWAGAPKGSPFNEKYCAAGIWSGGRGSLPGQCGKKPGHGPDGLYCKVHTQQLFPEHDKKAETWFEVSPYDWGIKTVKVSSYSEQFVWLLGGNGSRKALRKDKFSAYYPTKEIAVSMLIDRAKNKIALAQIEIEEATKALKNLTE
jgi:hypothetical protein